MTISNHKPLTYRDAGVDIEAGDAFVDAIKPLAAATGRKGVMGSIGGFAGLFDLKADGWRDPILVSGTDGVGTKLMLAFETGKHDTIGIDLVAMCANDVLAQGAEPLLFLDYFATGRLEPGVAEAVIAGIANGCREAGCALLGGETAEMPGMYPEGHYDLAGFVVGAVERDRILPNHSIMRAGDQLIGLPSSGPHSNGYSLIRACVDRSCLTWTDAAPFASDISLGEALLTPTRLYAKSCLPLIEAGLATGLAHVTGGGLIENPPRMCPDHLVPDIDYSTWQAPAVFDWIQETGGVETLEMRRTFNMGIGMIVSVPSDKADEALALLRELGETAVIIGELAEA
ncbi:MAG: phosphoribosylformylglycinamidine cyclo-ligase [Pseudomonadota bacterium]